MDFGRVYLGHRTASQLVSQRREAARTAPNFAQPIILAYGTCALAKFSRHSAGAWLTLIAPNKKKINVTLKAKVLDPLYLTPLTIRLRRVIHPN